MGEEAKKILADNNRMFEELKFHHAESSENQADKVEIYILSAFLTFFNGNFFL